MSDQGARLPFESEPEIEAYDYREILAERIFVATILDASDGIKDDADYDGLSAFWGERCLRMADGFVEALRRDRERKEAREVKDPYLRCEGDDGHQHVLRRDEWEAGLHRVRVYRNGRESSCVCDPRSVRGVIVHRQMTRGGLYAPWLKGGH